jgi:hypothetical protein
MYGPRYPAAWVEAKDADITPTEDRRTMRRKWCISSRRFEPMDIILSGVHSFEWIVRIVKTNQLLPIDLPVINHPSFHI